MELRLVVEARARPARDVAVDVEPDHPVSELVSALATHLALQDDPARLSLYCRRTGSWLSGDQEVGTAGLRTGDHVDVCDRATPLAARAQADGRTALVDLLVVGGPDAGRRIPLGSGEHRVGSFRYASVLIEDPSLSKVHVVVSVSALGGVTLSDPGSETGTFVGGRPIAGPTPVELGQLVVCARSLLVFRRSGDARTGLGRAAAQDRSGRVMFNRPPRVALSRPDCDFKLPAPPTRQRGGQLPVTSALVMLVMTGAMYFAMGRQTYMLIFFVLSPLMYVGTWLDGSIGGGWSYRRSARRYLEQVERLDGEIAAAWAEEARYVQAEAPDAVALVERAHVVDAGLWDRRPDSPDWLLLRVGWSDLPSSISLEIQRGGGQHDEQEERLRQEAMRLLERYRRLPLAPLTVSLKEAGVVGLSGDQKMVASTARWLCLQLAVLHSPQDLVLTAVVPEAERDQWAWLGWLPHLGSERAPLPGPLVANDRASAHGLVDRLLTVVRERRSVSDSETGERFEPTIVLLVREGVALPRGALAELLRQGPKVGIHAIWVGAHGHALPGECGAVIEAEPATLESVVTLPDSGETFRGGGTDGVSLMTATDAALALAPVRDVSSRQRQVGIPRRVQLLELMGMQDDPEGRILQEWIRDRSSPADRQLSALLGVGAGGETFEVHLRFDGPHALVGGMTGSGKSELLQTLVAALAASHSPRTLNFLLVDYKGGAAFKDCVDLPHTVGFVTDLDGHLVDRAMVSLRAELRRREGILREAGAKDLPDLEHMDPDRAPASLLIVIDEFAALAAELPEFVDGMVDVAQRGRSLGIHLMLATQRPAGVINDRIRANTNLRISLRFSEDTGSIDVVGTADAARAGLPPGRAFARVGPGQVTEFQAGYVGGHTAASRGLAPVVVRDIDFGASVAGASDRRVVRGEGATDLQRLVAAAIDVNGKLGQPPPVRPWLPTLPEVLPLEALSPPARSRFGAPRATIGLVDDPAGQRQYPLEFALDEDSGLLVLGATGSGKTTALRSLTVSLARSSSPAELQIYALDFASRGLKALEALPHCGAVIAGDETERVMRILTMLRSEADRRKSLLAETGTTNLGEYLAARPQESLPRILLLLDGVSGFATAFEGSSLAADDLLLQLLGEGRPLGISFVLAASRNAGLASRLGAGIGRRLILRLSNEDEYSMLGLPRTAYAGAHLPPGRGFSERGLEVQCALVGSDPAGGAQAAAVASLGAELRRRSPAVAVPQVGTLPRELPRASLPAPGAPLEAVFGLDDANLEPARVDLQRGHFLVSGPRGSGRTTALAAFAASLAAGPQPPHLLLLAPHLPSPLAALGVWASTALGADACAELLRELAEALRAGEVGRELPAAVLVIDDGDQLTGESEDLDWIAERGRDQDIRIVAAVPNHVAQRAYSGWLAEVARDRQGVLLDPDTTMDGNILNVRLPSRRSGAWPPGRGYLVCRGSVALVQVAGS
jgi:S-DNA-T family DNA segregation ATPase FtsK/SpoIIIE